MRGVGKRRGYSGIYSSLPEEQTQAQVAGLMLGFEEIEAAAEEEVLGARAMLLAARPHCSLVGINHCSAAERVKAVPGQGMYPLQTWAEPVSFLLLPRSALALPRRA